MPRRLRIEFEGAIYHVMARGNARQKIVRDDADRRRLLDGLEHTVVRHGWELLCYVVMGNHLHLLVKTPRPNLGAGMQSFLSGYANYYYITSNNTYHELFYSVSEIDSGSPHTPFANHCVL